MQEDPARCLQQADGQCCQRAVKNQRTDASQLQDRQATLGAHTPLPTAPSCWNPLARHPPSPCSCHSPLPVSLLGSLGLEPWLSVRPSVPLLTSSQRRGHGGAPAPAPSAGETTEGRGEGRARPGQGRVFIYNFSYFRRPGPGKVERKMNALTFSPNILPRALGRSGFAGA